MYLTIDGEGIFRVGERVGLQLTQPLRCCRVNVVRMRRKTKRWGWTEPNQILVRVDWTKPNINEGDWTKPNTY